MKCQPLMTFGGDLNNPTVNQRARHVFWILSDTKYRVSFTNSTIYSAETQPQIKHTPPKPRPKETKIHKSSLSTASRSSKH